MPLFPSITEPYEDVRKDLSERELLALETFLFELADIARAAIESVRRSGLGAKRKADKSVVTEADLQAERAVRNKIQSRYPDHGILGEEFGATHPDSDYQWVLDPVDGTEEFSRDVPLWATLIGLFYRGHPILGLEDHTDLNRRVSACFKKGVKINGESIPQRADVDRPLSERVLLLSAKNEMNHFPDDERLFNHFVNAYPHHRIFRCAYARSSVGSGLYDAMVDFNIKPWDFAATRLITEESGGLFVPMKDVSESGGERKVSAIFGSKPFVERLVEEARGVLTSSS